MHTAKVLADSIANGCRLTTFEVTFPRIVLAEVNTHRVFSRCSASSRAIPIEKMIEKAMTQPYIPSEWLSNKKGMQGGDALVCQADCDKEWLKARDAAVAQVRALDSLGVHKQWANRLLEPFLWHTAIISATEYENFFCQRIHPDAHPDIFKAARAMLMGLEVSTPVEFYGEWEWHLPFIQKEDFELYPDWKRNYEWKKVSVGRCARISYMTHDGKRDPIEDIRLHDTMMLKGHMSPYEHVARPMSEKEIMFGDAVLTQDKGWKMRVPFRANLKGWVQYRKEIDGESNMLDHIAKLREIDKGR